MALDLVECYIGTEACEYLKNAGGRGQHESCVMEIACVLSF